MAALASLAAVPLAGVTAGTVMAAHTARLADRLADRAVPAVSFHGKPLYKRTSGPNASGTFSCQAPQSSTNPVPCYAPAQIRRAYNIPRSLTGAGETIVIVDAFQSPTIVNDLALFDSVFGLPSPTLNIIAPQGLTPFDPTNPDQVGWAGEISLDVEWSHAIAPGATIDLVLAKSDQDPDILAAQQYVVNHNLGDVLSQSFGEGETCMAPSVFAATHKVFERALKERMTVFASAGDSGAAQQDCNNDGNFFLSASTPASDPLVTGVGGTHLNANFTTGAYQSETVWNNSGENPNFGAGGGGFSTFYQRPFYQYLVRTGSSSRGVPDVTYNGDLYGGVLAVWSSSGQGADLVFIFGGTSAGTQQWAGITALADQAAGHRLGFLNPALYAIGASPLDSYAFHDITVGNNSWDVSGVTGYPAARGWDPASGLGSPNAAHLIRLLTGR
jgi:subtilase family serine protease